jgi:hypothetical protein
MQKRKLGGSQQELLKRRWAEREANMSFERERGLVVRPTRPPEAKVGWEASQQELPKKKWARKQDNQGSWK